MLYSYGFTLLEVMISFMLVSIAVLGMDVMAVQSLHQNLKTYQLSIAVNEMQNIRERLQALQDNAGLQEQLISWNQDFKSVLPKSESSINGSFPNYEVSLWWGDKGRDACQKLSENCLTMRIHVV
jgi:Tfp pilus assembly protein PilV